MPKSSRRNRPSKIAREIAKATAEKNHLFNTYFNQSTAKCARWSSTCDETGVETYHADYNAHRDLGHAPARGTAKCEVPLGTDRRGREHGVSQKSFNIKKGGGGGGGGKVMAGVPRRRQIAGEVPPPDLQGRKATLENLCRRGVCSPPEKYWAGRRGGSTISEGVEKTASGTALAKRMVAKEVPFLPRPHGHDQLVMRRNNEDSGEVRRLALMICGM